ncbi:MAG: hypothetical protein HPY69_06830 [Armatimonadetes bacterium]|nr:hypothetical protein [Armatimonadota bacterium]
MRRGPVTLLVVAALGLAAWWLLVRPRPTDEERIYRLVADAARAVEMRNPSGVLRLVSESYHDPYGNSKRTLTQQVIAGLRSIDAITVVPEIASLEIQGDVATALVRARVRFGDATEGRGVDLQVRLQLAREGRVWRVTSSDGWAPAVDSYLGE